MLDINKIPMYADGIQEKDVRRILDTIFHGLFERIGKHTNKPFNSTHEIYGKMMEEVHEFMEEVIGNDDKKTFNELLDVVCAGIWGLLSIEHWEKS